ncbi:aldo/keto reductase [Amycolatopsis acidicola]|uniref:Aldo/keto reductase n=1 Tax=Amycolatopsis acidicola TaxID=2596893 RepID=A0A5N0VIK6_9PSEU|nr:aldo/keto reductase [Amycolatopsis acidicola]
MPARSLGAGLTVSALGLGTIGLSPGVYGEISEDEAVRAIRGALDGGVTLIDTADAYGSRGEGERLVGRAIEGRREEVVLSTKFGYAGPDQGRRISVGYRMKLFVDGSPEHVARAIDASLERLGVDRIDLWYLHFPDPGVAVEETVGAMAEQVRAGKVGHLGLSNVTADELRRAAAVHPIAAVQTEYSLWHRDPERELIPACDETGTGLVAWGPLGSGFLADRRFLSGEIKEMPGRDFRSRNARFSPENLAANVSAFGSILDLARQHGYTPAQLALAWLMAKGAVPIPGAGRPQHLAENLAAGGLSLSPELLAEVDTRFPAAAGAAFRA